VSRLGLLFALGVPLSYARAPGRAAAVYTLPWVALTALADLCESRKDGGAGWKIFP